MKHDMKSLKEETMICLWDCDTARRKKNTQNKTKETTQTNKKTNWTKTNKQTLKTKFWNPGKL